MNEELYEKYGEKIEAKLQNAYDKRGNMDNKVADEEIIQRDKVNDVSKTNQFANIEKRMSVISLILGILALIGLCIFFFL